MGQPECSCRNGSMGLSMGPRVDYVKVLPGCDDATMTTFALGLGCQKGGTSWLHDYLAASPQCDPGFRKEYHVFDGLDLPSEAWMRRRVVARAAKAVDALERGAAANADALRQAAFYADPETYFDYFAGLLGRAGVRLTCDITPVVRPAARRRGWRDPGGLRPPRRAHGAGVLDAGPGRADLVDGADEPAAPPRASSPAPRRTGWPPVRARRPRDPDPLRPHPGGDGRGVRTGRAVGRLLRAALRRRRPRRPLCATSASTTTPPTSTTSSTPHRRARPSGRPGGAGRRALPRGVRRGGRAASRTSTSARSGRAAVSLRLSSDPSRAGATPRRRPRSAGRSPRAAAPRRAGTWGR